MYFKDRLIKEKKYRYAAVSIRLPDGKVKVLEKIFKGERGDELARVFDEAKKKAYLRFMLDNYRIDHVFTEEEFEKIEEMRMQYSRILLKLTGASYRDFLDRFTANFTYESNALEGNSLTLKDVAMVMFENVSVGGKDLREVYETRNSREIVEMIIANKFKVNYEDIVRLHKMLVRDLGIGVGYKKFPNVLVGKCVELTPPEMVYGEMDELIGWYHENASAYHPVKLAALFHGRFEKIHPFEDGNGRVGRFLINVILVNNRYPPLIIRKSQRIAYIGALEKFDSGYSDGLVRFVLRRFKDTYGKFFEEYVRYLDG